MKQWVPSTLWARQYPPVTAQMITYTRHALSCVADAISRLRKLPEVFTFADFCRRTGYSRNAAAVCLHRWKVRELIEVRAIAPTYKRQRHSSMSIQLAFRFRA